MFKGTHASGKVTIGKDKEVCGDSKLDPVLVVGSQGEVKNAVIQIADLKQAVSVATKKRCSIRCSASMCRMC